MRFLAVIYQYTLAKPFLEKLSILLSGLPEPEELSNLNSMANTCASLPILDELEQSQAFDVVQEMRTSFSTAVIG